MAKAPGSVPLTRPTRIDGLDPRGQLIVPRENKQVGDGGTTPSISRDPGTQ